jgi:hypothetical protein
MVPCDVVMTKKNNVAIENYTMFWFRSFWRDKLCPVDKSENDLWVYPGMLVKWPGVLDLGMILSVTHDNVSVMWCEVWEFV